MYSELQTSDLADVQQFIQSNAGRLADAHLSLRIKNGLYLVELSTGTESAT